MAIVSEEDVVEVAVAEVEVVVDEVEVVSVDKEDLIRAATVLALALNLPIK